MILPEKFCRSCALTKPASEFYVKTYPNGKKHLNPCPTCNIRKNARTPEEYLAVIWEYAA